MATIIKRTIGGRDYTDNGKSLRSLNGGLRLCEPDPPYAPYAGISRNPYYYYTRSYRVKDSPKANGKARGSGKSRVRTEQICLGTAEDVIRRIQSQQSPEKVRTTSFGIEAVALKVIQELGLVEIIDRHVANRHQGLSMGHYIATATINRLVKATSRAGIADWLNTTTALFFVDLDCIVVS